MILPVIFLSYHIFPLSYCFKNVTYFVSIYLADVFFRSFSVHLHIHSILDLKYIFHIFLFKWKHLIGPWGRKLYKYFCNTASQRCWLWALNFLLGVYPLTQRGIRYCLSPEPGYEGQERGSCCFCSPETRV